jgi:membrane associated rhomboid family serine protease
MVPPGRAAAHFGSREARGLCPPSHRGKREDTRVLPFVFRCGIALVVRLALPDGAVYPRGAQVSVTDQPNPKVSEAGISGPKDSEPIFNLPLIVILTAAVLILIHLVRVYVLSDDEDAWLVLTFAFIPARYSIDFVEGSLPGGFGADLWTFFSYAFLHADYLHLGLNLAWLLPFATALARRFGAWRYTAFMLVMSAAGALAHLVSHLGATEPMIGASAAISGAMAGAMRFVFQAGGPLAVLREYDEAAYRVPARSLAATLRDPRFLLFLAVWFGLNALFGTGTVSFAGEAGQQIAWQAHVGGFLAGLILFKAFDPVVAPRDFDAAPPRQA